MKKNIRKSLLNYKENMTDKDMKAIMKLIMKLEIEIKTKLIEYDERLESLEKKKKK